MMATITSLKGKHSGLPVSSTRSALFCTSSHSSCQLSSLQSDCIMDVSRPFGHELVLAAMLQDEIIWDTDDDDDDSEDDVDVSEAFTYGWYDAATERPPKKSKTVKSEEDEKLEQSVFSGNKPLLW